MAMDAENKGKPKTSDAQPYINVTPLIDVLLVLLIIFMVISPQKPHRFETKIPEKPPEEQKEQPPDPLSLLITVPPKGGGAYKLNTQEAKTLQDLQDQLFKALNGRPNDRKAVFIKGPIGLPYGEIVKVIDVATAAGAQPIGLQIEGLDQ
jgi:biopolymer transport protein ExbD